MMSYYCLGFVCWNLFVSLSFYCYFDVDNMMMMMASILCNKKMMIVGGVFVTMTYYTYFMTMMKTVALSGWESSIPSQLPTHILVKLFAIILHVLDSYKSHRHFILYSYHGLKESRAFWTYLSLSYSTRGLMHFHSDMFLNALGKCCQGWYVLNLKYFVVVAVRNIVVVIGTCT